MLLHTWNLNVFIAMRSFRKLTIATLVAVYLLILVGGVVRSTGSGMGCPDWPRCFGQWVPPTSVEELPADYKQEYAAYRDKKNKRFAKYLRVLGMEATAEKLLSNPQVLHENDFNPTKTWIEYVNRLVGVAIGIMIFAVFVSSVKYWNIERKLTIIAFATLILVGFQGWIGSFVVSTNLTPWTVTVHMFLALVIVALLVYLIHQTSERMPLKSSVGIGWLLACLGALVVQILFGTEVREAIDAVAAMAVREKWIEEVGNTFVLHRSFSWMVLLLNVGLIWRLSKTEGAKVFPLIIIVLILSTILTGAAMAYFAIPAFLQPVHLLLATVSFGLQFLLLLRLNVKKEVQSIS
jgi:cytochrome c oxidase assembly protein subunit 15